MSPTPLIELQRRLAEAGRIRMGEKSDKGAPKRLTTWRITSPTKELIEQAAALYGGEPKPWESPTGPQWEVVTTSTELPVLVMPAYSLRQQYEYRTSPTLVERRCDGTEMDDGTPCLCNTEGEDKCDLITRLTVALPELTTMLGWRLESKGDAAARELLASNDLIQGVAGGRPFVPAKLRIVERRGNKNGQATRFVVPVIDPAVSYAELVGRPQQRELPAGYTPLEVQAFGTSLAEGLETAETQTITRKPRVSLPDDDVEDEHADPGAEPSAQAAAGATRNDGDVAPSAPAEDPAGPSSHPAANTPSRSAADPPAPQVISQAQRKRLFAIAKEHGIDKDTVRAYVRSVRDGNESTDGMTVAEYERLIEKLEGETAGAAA